VTVLDDLDILAGAGDYATVLTQRIEPVSASGGVITLRLLTASGTVDTDAQSITQRPEISGMVIWTYTPPVPPPVPTKPTPTPPLGGGSGVPPSDGGGTFFPMLVPISTQTPTPTVTPALIPTLAPTPEPVAGSTGFVGGSGSGVDVGASTVLAIPTRVIAAIGNARLDLTTAGSFDGTPLMTIHLTLRDGTVAGAYELAIAQALVRGADLEAMAVDHPLPLVLVVDLSDLELLAFAYGSVDGDADFDARVNLNGDGRIDLRDLALLGAGHE
jgi:hypothetical protein